MPYAELKCFRAEPCGDGVKIIGYHGSTPNLKIPAALDGRRVLMIGMEAFVNKHDLIKVSIPEGVESIEEGAFRNCDKLEQVALPVSVREVGYEAFRGCCALREIAFQKNVRTVGDYCFYLCKKLRSVAFVPSAEHVSLGFNCFQECDELLEAVMPVNAGYVGMYCFNKCERLAELKMPARIDAMAEIVVHNCPGIRRIEFPGALPGGYEGAIVKHCPNLEQLIAPAGALPEAAAEALRVFGARHVIRLEAPTLCLDEETMTLRFDAVENAAGYSATFHYANADRSVSEIVPVVFETHGKTCSARIRASVDQAHNVSFSFEGDGGDVCASFTVTVRATGGFGYADSSESAALTFRNRKTDFIADKCDPATLHRYVGIDAEVVIPNEFSRIGDEAFAFHDQLETVRFSKTLESVGRRSFFHCKRLRTIDWGESRLETIGQEAFAYCFGLTELKLPDSVYEIGEQAFEVCSGITRADLSDTIVTRIENSTFRRCIALKQILYPATLTAIGDKAFRGCTALLPGTLPERLKKIGGSAFSFMMDAEEIALPANLREVASDFLYYSTGVAKISVDERCPDFTVRDNTLLRVRKTDQTCRFDAVAYPIDGPAERYCVPNGVEKIFRYAYRDLEHAREIVIGDDVTEIEEENFSCCWNLTRIVIGKNVQKIGPNCFSHNISLEEIVLTSDRIPRSPDNSFVKNSQNVRVLFGRHTYYGTKNGESYVWKNESGETVLPKRRQFSDPETEI